jgi:phage-related baseplate assembly protein
MSTPSLSDLYTPLTREQVTAKLLEIADTFNFDITAWEALGSVRTFLSIIAQAMANETQTTTLISRSVLLSFAANTDGTINSWLTLFGESWFNVPREEATFAQTTETLSNATGAPYTINPGDLHFAVTTGTNAGALYSNTTGGILPASGTLDVTIVADVAGASSSANSGEITTMVTPLAGVTATNSDPATGKDDESDASYVSRLQSSFGALSPNGPEDAYRFFALNAKHADGTPVDVNRASVTPHSSTGQVGIYVASSSGVVPGTVGNLATDLGLVADNIFRNAMPLTDTPTIASAVGLNVDIQATVYMRATNTLDAATVKAKVLSALLKYFGTVPIGGTDIGGGGKLFLDAVIGEIYQAIPGQVAQVIITSPGADVSMTVSQVAILTSVTGDFTVVQL